MIGLHLSGFGQRARVCVLDLSTRDLTGATVALLDGHLTLMIPRRSWSLRQTTRTTSTPNPPFWQTSTVSRACQSFPEPFRWTSRIRSHVRVGVRTRIRIRPRIRNRIRIRVQAQVCRWTVAHTHPIVVLVEKPLCPTASQAQELVDLAKRQGVILSVYQNRRWDSDFLTVKKLLKEGTVSAVMAATSKHR
jgi:hypothetical protein